MRVLITGAGRAIGRASAQELATRGHEVVATARDPTLLEDLDVAQRLALDICDEDSIDAALERCGELDAIVNNAGLTGSGPIEDFPVERLRAVLDTNVLGPIRLVQKVIAPWRARGSGVIINLSSVQGRVSPPLEGVYAASKHALEALSEAMYLELTHFGIRVVIIEPGYIAPGMKHTHDHQGPAAYQGLWDQWAGTDTKVTGPAGRPAPQLVARAIAQAIEDPTTPLRVEVGEDAKMVLGLRRQLDDQAFEQTMREFLGLTW